MPLNPMRVMTTAFKKLVIAQQSTEDSSGPLCSNKAFVVTDITVSGLQNALSGITLGTHGMQTGVSLGNFSPPVESAAGKVYQASQLLTFTAASPVGAETFKGVVISPTNNATDAFVYLEFDEPITVNEDGESIQLKIEYGLDGNTFYIVPRLLNLGE